MRILRPVVAVFAVMAPLAAHAAPPITLKLGFPPPPVSHFYGGTLVPWANEIEKATHGQLKIQIFAGGTLASHRNGYDRMLNGVADIVFGLHGIMGNTFQKTSVTALPGFPATGAQCTQAVWALYTSGVIADEYEKVRPLGFSCFPPTAIISRRELRKIGDVNGLKISVTSRIYGQEIEVLGGAPITLATPEIYQAMQRGLVDGATVGMAAVAAYKLTEVASYYLNAPLGQTTEYLLMNKELRQAARGCAQGFRRDDRPEAVDEPRQVGAGGDRHGRKKGRGRAPDRDGDVRLGSRRASQGDAAGRGAMAQGHTRRRKGD